MRREREWRKANAGRGEIGGERVDTKRRNQEIPPPWFGVPTSLYYLAGNLGFRGRAHRKEGESKILARRESPDAVYSLNSPNQEAQLGISVPACLVISWGGLSFLALRARPGHPTPPALLPSLWREIHACWSYPCAMHASQACRIIMWPADGDEASRRPRFR